MARDAGNAQRALPTPGLHNAVCADVHYLGFEETPWGDKEKILVVWEIDEDHPEFGGPFRVNRKYTLSLNEKATLCQDLESWRGKAFTAEERRGFDVERLIGAPCTLNVVHNETATGTWANVKAVLPIQRGAEALRISEDYVRLKDRPDAQPPREATPTQPAEAGAPLGEASLETWQMAPQDDLPF